LVNKNSDWDFVITPNRGWLEINFKEIFYYKDLLWLFVKRDYTTQFKQTILGPIWFILQPLIYTIVFTFIFNGVAKISTGDAPPILFYMSGIIAWNYFSGCLITTSGTFLSNAGLFGKVYFPRMIVPISKSISGLIKVLVQFIMFFGFYTYYHFVGELSINNSPTSFFLLPLFILQMAIFGQGLGLIVASMTIKYRDLTYLVNFGTQLLMYASPIVYPLEIVPEKYKYIILANPMTVIIEGFRRGLLGIGGYESGMLLYSVSVTLIIFIVGIIIFNKTEQNFIDTI
tara:strand:- start:233 stop:1090 length:858 start_codon:yes stop_codon:yes gene_type:complete